MKKGFDIRTKIDGADTINPERRGVNVYTSDGRFVAYLPVLPFIIPPTVITWGNRTFVLRDITTTEEEATSKSYTAYLKSISTPKQYRETFNYVCPLFYDEKTETWIDPTNPETWLGDYSQNIRESVTTYFDEVLGGENYPEIPKETVKKKRSCFMPSCGLDGKLCPDCQFQ